MAINFPSSPLVGEVYSYSGTSWEWNGIYWGVYSAQSAFISSLVTVGTGSPVVYDVSGGTGFFYSISGLDGISVFTSGQTIYIQPTGLSTELEKLYDSNLGYLYCGVAPNGSTQSDTTWKITRIFVYNDGTVTTGIASDVDWINRYTHTYT